MILAALVGQPLRVRQWWSRDGPAARWMAPSTPPPPRRESIGFWKIVSYLSFFSFSHIFCFGCLGDDADDDDDDGTDYGEEKVGERETCGNFCM